jgi:uncharacterized protein
LLTVGEFNVAARYFGITERGNFVDHSHPSPLPGQNVLSVAVELIRSSGRKSAQTLQPSGLRNEPTHDGEEDPALFASAKKKMFAARSQRVRPHRDDKILASWNGLMLGAFARAYAVLGDEIYRSAAENNLAFIQSRLWEPVSQSAVLHHRWRDGERDNVQLLQAYAFLLEGVIHLYEATLEPKHLDFAIALAEAMIAKFYDAESGGFWQSAADAKGLILRVKDDHDGAEPSGNSVATLALLKLAALTDRADFRKPAEATLRLFAKQLQKMPQAVAYMLHALDFWMEEPRRVVIAGEPRAAKTHELLRATHSVYQPNKVVLGNIGPVAPFARILSTKDSPAVYLCTGKSCQAPTSDGAKVQEMLR